MRKFIMDCTCKAGKEKGDFWHLRKGHGFFAPCPH